MKREEILIPKFFVFVFLIVGFDQTDKLCPAGSIQKVKDQDEEVETDPEIETKEILKEVEKPKDEESDSIAAAEPDPVNSVVQTLVERIDSLEALLARITTPFDDRLVAGKRLVVCLISVNWCRYFYSINQGLLSADKVDELREQGKGDNLLPEMKKKIWLQWIMDGFWIRGNFRVQLMRKDQEFTDIKPIVYERNETLWQLEICSSAPVNKQYGNHRFKLFNVNKEQYLTAYRPFDVGQHRHPLRARLSKECDHNHADCRCQEWYIDVISEMD